MDPAVTEAATGIGMTRGERLFRVELPLAFPVGARGHPDRRRVGVGLATIAAAIGAGGLGVLIYRGVATVDTGTSWPAPCRRRALALLCDAASDAVEKRVRQQ